MQPDTALQVAKLQVANKILAQVETADPAALMETAKEAARQTWRLQAAKVLRAIRSDKGSPLEKKLWRAQSQDILEFFAAWVPLPDPDQYQVQRQRLETLLAARKNSRDFLPSGVEPTQAAGQHKSSLDGLRESVLHSRRFTRLLRRRWGLDETEELDCPGLVKRVGSLLSPKFAHFTPLSRIALDPWVRGLVKAEAGKQYLTALEPTLSSLVGARLASRVQGNEGKYQDLPYDGQLLYRFRLEAQQAQLQPDQPDNQEALRAVLAALGAQLRPVWTAFQEPQPYLAILTADGDKMGEFLDKIQTLEIHQAISRELSAFAREVPVKVREHRGHCIYAGGDDVLALLPLDQAIACAHALAVAFHAYINTAITSLPPAKRPQKLPTLSVGIMIGHFLEPLGSLLRRARRAEKLAKGDDTKSNSRNALAVILKSRSGAEIAVRSGWGTNPKERFQTWVSAFQDNTLPDRTPYLLRQAAPTLTWLQQRGDNAFDREITRLLRRRRVNDESTPTPISDALLTALRARAALQEEGGIEGLIDELLIARVIAVAARQAAGSADRADPADSPPGATDA